MPVLLQQSIKEASRPFLSRESGQVGIYIDITEAEQNEQRHGSDHYYVMLLTETLYQAFKELDSALIKGYFEKENICRGVVFEEFREGIVLLASPENTEALEQLRCVYEAGKLCQILQGALITNDLLKAIRASNITIRTRMWQDEYDSCAEELAHSQKSCNIKDSDADLKYLRRAKEAQTVVAGHILELRDGEDKFEQSLGEFINILKNHYKSNLATSSLKHLELQTNVLRKDTPKAKINFDALDHYFAMVKTLRQVYDFVDKELRFPLAQIHSWCENEKQRDVKQAMLQICRETSQALTDENDLNKACYPPWEGKILPREKDIVFGTISLIPMAISRLSDLDHLLDEYLVAGDIHILNKS